MAPTGKKWRRRESNANEEIPNDSSGNKLEFSPESPSTQGPRNSVFDCRDVTEFASEVTSPALDYIAAAWPHLQPHVREAIITLIECSTRANERKGGSQ